TCRTSSVRSTAPPGCRRARSSGPPGAIARSSKFGSPRLLQDEPQQGGCMYDHIGLKVKDLDASVRFYEAALKPVGYVVCSRDASSAGLGPPGEPALWLTAAGKGTAGSGVHVAFRAQDRGA